MAAEARNLKEERIAMRATSRQVEVIDRAAETVHKTRSDFMLDVAFAESTRILADQRLFVLNNTDRDEFIKLLDRPAEVIPELRALFESTSGLDERDAAQPLAG